MGVDSGKFYDAFKTRTYCEGINDEFDAYSQAAGVQTDTFSDFASNTEWRGEDAVLGKNLVGNAENGNLSEILAIQNDLKNIQANCIDKFSYEVDGAPNALIKFDVLKRIDRDFQNLYMDFNCLGHEVETISDELNAKFSKYGSFTKPDFETGRNAFRDICGGDIEGTGFLSECMIKLTKYDSGTTEIIKESGILKHIQELSDRISKSDKAIAVMPLSAKTSMSNCSTKGIAEEYFPCNPDEEVEEFDGKGLYGAYQGDMFWNKSGWEIFSKYLWFEDKTLYNYVRKFPGYENATSVEIKNLFDGMREEGCGYSAMVNAIFVAYDGKEDEFKKTFGFSMYNKDGDLNFDQLFIDIYMNTDDKYWPQEKGGINSSVLAELKKYSDEGKEAEFKEKYGVDLFADDNKDSYTMDAFLALKAEYKDKDELKIKDEGVSEYAYQNRLTHYLNEHGVKCDVKVEEDDPLTTEQAQKYMDEGKTITIAADEFMLYDKDGKPVQDEPIGAHWMTITDITDDGEYVVSSWGGKYYFRPDEDEVSYYTTTDITASDEE